MEKVVDSENRKHYYVYFSHLVKTIFHAIAGQKSMILIYFKVYAPHSIFVLLANQMISTKRLNAKY